MSFQQPTFQRITTHQGLFSCTCSYLYCFKCNPEMLVVKTIVRPPYESWQLASQLGRSALVLAPMPPSAEAYPLQGCLANRAASLRANLRTKILDFRGFDSSRILISRGGIPTTLSPPPPIPHWP